MLCKNTTKDKPILVLNGDTYSISLQELASQACKFEGLGYSSFETTIKRDTY